MTEKTLRKKCTKAKRIVIKVGTHVLVDERGRPHAKCMAHLSAQISELIHAGKEVVLVSSGAIAAGVAMLKLKERPHELDKLQMAAAVGQTGLLNYYRRYFGKAKIIISQVLLTYDDFKHHQRSLNARNTINQLLRYGVIPIINENDVVAVDEIKIGDNDVLSALMAKLIDADLLILLTTPDGLQNTTKRVPYLKAITPEVLNLAFGKTSHLSTGGMKTKLQAAGIALNSNIPVIIASGKQKDVIKNIMQASMQKLKK